MRPLKTFAAAAAAALALALAGTGFAQSPGTSENEIRIGGSHDLSGIFAPFSVPGVTAVQLYFDEVNANGGVHGRMLKYIVEDHGYQVPRAVQAANKLINRDDVFAMLLNLGTPHNLAMFKLMEPKGIPNVSPLTAARQMIDPPAPWKFAGTASYYDGVKSALTYLMEEEGAESFCTMILPTDFGKEIEAAVQDLASERGITVAAQTTHKPDETDFTGALSKVRDSGCDTVGMALGISQVINAIATARKLGMDDLRFVLSSAGFHTVVAKGLAQQGVMSGVYAGSGWQDLEARVSEPAVADWVGKWKEATGENLPGTGALLGRMAAEILVRGLEAAGPDLTRESFIAAMETLDYPDEIGGGKVHMEPGDHVAVSEIFVSKIENGSWKTVKTIE